VRPERAQFGILINQGTDKARMGDAAQRRPAAPMQEREAWHADVAGPQRHHEGVHLQSVNKRIK